MGLGCRSRKFRIKAACYSQGQVSLYVMERYTVGPERDTERERYTERDTEREIQRERHREMQRERETERYRE